MGIRVVKIEFGDTSNRLFNTDAPDVAIYHAIELVKTVNNYSSGEIADIIVEHLINTMRLFYTFDEIDLENNTIKF